MAPARRPASAGPVPSLAPWIIAAGAAGGGAALYFGYPPVPVLWAAVLAAAWLEQPAVLTGKKDSSGYPTAAHPGEERRMTQWQAWKDLRSRLWLPNGDWMPGWPVLASWLAAVTVGLLCWMIPVPHSMVGLKGVTEGDARLADAVLGFVLVAQVAATIRKVSSCPGTRVDSLIGLARSKPFPTAFAAAVGAAGGAVGAAVATSLISKHPSLHVYHGRLLDVRTANDGLVWPAVIAAGVLVALSPLWVPAALDRWRKVTEATRVWTPRWQSLKYDPVPALVDHREVGPAVVDTFEAPSHLGAVTFWPLAPKIAPTMGSGLRIAVLEVPEDGPQGPTPGTRHPTRFEIAAWPSDALPDLSDQSVPDDVAALYAHCVMVWTLEIAGYGRPVPTGITKITTDDSPHAVWRSTWAWPGGPSLTEIRPLCADIADRAGCPVLIDHRGDDGGAVYFGALDDPETVYDDSEDWADVLEKLADEDRWSAVWSAALKMGMQAPTVHTTTYAEKSLADGTVVYRQPFLCHLGDDPTMYFGFEDRISTAMRAKPFVAITGWPVTSDRPGERHPQAFSLYWSDSQVPASPDRLPPSPASAWVIAGQVNRAFAAAKMPRPEVVSAKALTRPGDGPHIWEISLRLYGGVTLADVRHRAEALRQSLGSPWLRVGEVGDGAILFAGASPETAKLAHPEVDAVRLAGLDWEQAWSDSHVVNPAGLLPELTSIGNLPSNPVVEVLDFRLPSGIDLTMVRMAISKLRSATGNQFIDVRDSPDGPGSVRLLVSVENPLPKRVQVNFELVDRFVSEDRGIPFATGVEGEPVVFDPLESPHALLSGTTGSGKSVLATVFLYGFAAAGAHIVVIDPIKGGADFKFLEPYADAFASTPLEAAAALKGVYSEVTRRKTLNAQHSVGSYRDLPEDARPKPVVVMVDEFTSLIGQSSVSKPSDNPELELEREALIAENQARVEVGMFVGKLAREARSAGVTLLLGTQKLNRDMLEKVPGSSDIKTNLARTLLGKTSSGDRMSALRAFEDAPQLLGEIPKGRGLWEPLSSAAVIIQSWFSPQEELGEQLARRRQPLDPADRITTTGAAAASLSEPDTDSEVIDVGEFVFELPEEPEEEPVPDTPPPEPSPPAEPVADSAGWGWDEPLDWGEPAAEPAEPEDGEPSGWNDPLPLATQPEPSPTAADSGTEPEQPDASTGWGWDEPLDWGQPAVDSAQPQASGLLDWEDTPATTVPTPTDPPDEW